MEKPEEKITSTAQVVLDYLSPELAVIFMAKLTLTLPDDALTTKLVEHFNKVHEELHDENAKFFALRNQRSSR